MAIILQLKNNAQVTVEQIKNAILSNNGKFQGDEKSGSIDVNSPLGAVAGDYRIDGTQITIDIKKKPFFITEVMIKNELEKYL